MSKLLQMLNFGQYVMIITLRIQLFVSTIFLRFLRLEGKMQNIIIQFSYVNNCLGP